MSEFSRISFIGSGNVAWHLAPALENCGYAVSEVYSPTSKNADALVKRLYNGKRKNNLDFSNSMSDIFFLCISDDEIEEVAKEIVLPDDSILLHTSGAVSIDVLSYSAASSLGVLYPIQTFSKDQKIDFKNIPILIESSDKSTKKLLKAMSKALSRNVVYASSEDRKLVHVAAVFASNFTNHMLTRSKDILDSKGYNFDILMPLVSEMINKSLKLGPEKAQTGPARRHDLHTLEEHEEVLDDESLKEIYRVISQDIIDHYP
jgi:predicted short-subunit dehydrogenase-like oxidoreductase (DUF2520 family)